MMNIARERLILYVPFVTSSFFQCTFAADATMVSPPSPPPHARTRRSIRLDASKTPAGTLRKEIALKRVNPGPGRPLSYENMVAFAIWAKLQHPKLTLKRAVSLANSNESLFIRRTSPSSPRVLTVSTLRKRVPALTGYAWDELKKYEVRKDVLSHAHKWDQKNTSSPPSSSSSPCSSPTPVKAWNPLSTTHAHEIAAAVVAVDPIVEEETAAAAPMLVHGAANICMRAPIPGGIQMLNGEEQQRLNGIQDASPAMPGWLDQMVWDDRGCYLIDTRTLLNGPKGWWPHMPSSWGFEEKAPAAVTELTANDTFTNAPASGYVKMLNDEEDAWLNSSDDLYPGNLESKWTELAMNDSEECQLIVTEPTANNTLSALNHLLNDEEDELFNKSLGLQFVTEEPDAWVHQMMPGIEEWDEIHTSPLVSFWEFSQYM